jgi:16S rRNA processing protein RimM
MFEYLKVGKVINVHGIKGEVKVAPLTDEPRRFYSLNKVYVKRDSSRIELTISQVRMHKNNLLVKFEEINDRDKAESFKGSYIEIDKGNAIELSKDQYFIYDLIGIKVYSMTGNLIGTIKDVLQTGPTDIYVLQCTSKEVLVPALKDIFIEIDIKNKKAKADIPEDLMNL